MPKVKNEAHSRKRASTSSTDTSTASGKQMIWRKNGWVKFIKLHRQDVAADNKGMPLQDIMKILGSMWKDSPHNPINEVKKVKGSKSKGEDDN